MAKSITVAGRELQLDGFGHLVDRNAWTHAVADALAALNGVELDRHQRAVLTFLRLYTDRHQIQPALRDVCAGVHRTLAEFYASFPGGLTQACRYAGLSIPRCG